MSNLAARVERLSKLYPSASPGGEGQAGLAVATAPGVRLWLSAANVRCKTFADVV